MCFKDLLSQFEQSSLYPQDGHRGSQAGDGEPIMSLYCSFGSYSLQCSIQYLSPNYDARNPKLLSVYLSVKDLEIDRKTIGQPAKILRKIIRGLSDQSYESFAAWSQASVDLALYDTATKPR